MTRPLTYDYAQRLFKAKWEWLEEQLMAVTVGQSQSMLATIYYFIKLIKRRHGGNLREVYELGTQGKALVAIASQSREAVENKTWDGGLQGFLRRLTANQMSFQPNVSNRKLQEVLALMEELGLIEKHSNGHGKVPHYSVNIPAMLIAFRLLVELIENGWGVAVPSFMKAVYMDVASFYKQTSTALKSLLCKPRYTHDERESLLEEFGDVFKPIYTLFSKISVTAFNEAKRFCGIRGDANPCCIVHWDVNLKPSAPRTKSGLLKPILN